MAIDFPASPTNGQTFTSGSVTYTWDGTKWTAVAAAGSTNSISQGNTNATVTDTGSDGRFVVTTEGSERLRVDSSGRLGIGSTSDPGGYNARLWIDNTADSTLTLNTTGSSSLSQIVFRNSNGNGEARLLNGTGGPLTFFRSFGNEAARIDSSGRLLVGTSSARSIGGDSPRFQIEGNTYADSSPAFMRYGNDAFSPVIQVTKTRSTTAGGVTAVQNGDQLVHIAFNGTDGSAYVEAANIKSFVDGTPGTNDMPGRLVFSTTADGASSPTERMRIDSNGFVNIGAYTIPSSTPGMQLYGAGNLIFCKRSDTGEAISFFANSTTKVGNIVLGASSTTYNTSSDYRLKENVVPLAGATERLKQLPVHRFNFIVEPDKTVDGFLAHEAADVVPECVTGEKDAVDDDGNPIYQGIDQSKLVPLLTAALQEAVARIETLEAKVAALESA